MYRAALPAGSRARGGAALKQPQPCTGLGTARGTNGRGDRRRECESWLRPHELHQMAHATICGCILLPPGGPGLAAHKLSSKQNTLGCMKKHQQDQAKADPAMLGAGGHQGAAPQGCRFAFANSNAVDSQGLAEFWERVDNRVGTDRGKEGVYLMKINK